VASRMGIGDAVRLGLVGSTFAATSSTVGVDEGTCVGSRPDEGTLPQMSTGRSPNLPSRANKISFPGFTSILFWAYKL